jgi:hypothetical protein
MGATSVTTARSPVAGTKRASTMRCSKSRWRVSLAALATSMSCMAQRGSPFLVTDQGRVDHATRRPRVSSMDKNRAAPSSVQLLSMRPVASDSACTTARSLSLASVSTARKYAVEPWPNSIRVAPSLSGSEIPVRRSRSTDHTLRPPWLLRVLVTR